MRTIEKLQQEVRQAEQDLVIRAFQGELHDAAELHAAQRRIRAIKARLTTTARIYGVQL